MRNDLRNAGNAIERAINENMTWLADAETQKLMLALLNMRHQEAEYRLNPSELGANSSKLRIACLPASSPASTARRK